MTRALATMAGAAAGLAFTIAAWPVAAQGAGPPVPPWGAWGAQGVFVAGGPAAFAGPSIGVLLGHPPVGCYITRVRADNRWLRAQICDWYY